LQSPKGIFAAGDRPAEARSVGRRLRPTTLFIFGNPQQSIRPPKRPEGLSTVYEMADYEHGIATNQINDRRAAMGSSSRG
jgi:hypothetical protein